MNKYFVTGIGTEVGKTIVSAIIVEALKADYWKPIQAGELDDSDSHKIKNLISNNRSKIFDNSYALQTPMSPHAAAKIDGINIKLTNITAPNTLNNLVIEGAGGLFVPLNKKETILDIIKKDYKIIIVSKHYLGSINHTLLTTNILQQKGFKIAGIFFNGNENQSTETCIQEISGERILGRLDEEIVINSDVIKKYADKFKKILKEI